MGMKTTHRHMEQAPKEAPRWGDSMQNCRVGRQQRTQHRKGTRSLPRRASLAVQLTEAGPGHLPPAPAPSLRHAHGSLGEASSRPSPAQGAARLGLLHCASSDQAGLPGQTWAVGEKRWDHEDTNPRAEPGPGQPGSAKARAPCLHTGVGAPVPRMKRDVRPAQETRNAKQSRLGSVRALF